MRSIIRNRSLVLSLFFAVLGGLATLVLLSEAQSESAPEMEQVVVASRSVAVGAPLSTRDLAVENWPKGRAPADAFHTVDEAVGAFPTSPLVRGELIRQSGLSETAPGSRLAAVIPDGRVAVSVAVNDVISTGGFIAPGDRVDVLGVVSKQANEDAAVVIQDITVLAVSGAIIGGSAKTEAESRSGGRENPRSLDTTVTLAVTLEEARRLVQVDEVGTLRLVLRPRDDQSATLQR